MCDEDTRADMRHEDIHEDIREDARDARAERLPRSETESDNLVSPHLSIHPASKIRERHSSMTRQTVGRWAFAGTLALAFGGCSLPPGQFIIVQDQVPDPGCVIPTTLGSIYRGTGTLDIRIVSDTAEDAYLLFPLLQNNLAAPQGQTADPNRIALSGYNVDITLPPADGIPADITQMFSDLSTSGPDGGPDHAIEFSVPTSGSVASGGGTTSSGLAVISGNLARQIRAKAALQSTAYIYLTATVRALGKTLTGNVESDAFHFPIRVCDGCLIADHDSIPACPVADAPANTGNECNPAQDGFVDCCDLDGSLVCPSVVASK
jgi:hypothetical protein